MLVSTPLTVECGVNLTVKFTMHEELVCCHSKHLAGLFAQAKQLRQQYERTKVLNDTLAVCCFPEVTPKQFESSGLEVQVCFRSTMYPSSHTSTYFTLLI